MWNHVTSCTSTVNLLLEVDTRDTSPVALNTGTRVQVLWNHVTSCISTVNLLLEVDTRDTSPVALNTGTRVQVMWNHVTSCTSTVNLLLEVEHKGYISSSSKHWYKSASLVESCDKLH